MLSELGHGLDIHNIETTATLLPSGDFLLHSPTDASAKYDYHRSFYFPRRLINDSVPGSCLLLSLQDFRA